MVNYYLATTLNHSENDLFPIGSAPLKFLRSLRFVHVPRLAADERFINLDFASELVKP